MVMHARKLPRINDGYYDRHPQGHSSYQNSKYSSSKNSSYSDRCNQDRSERSRNSPNGNTSRSNSLERDHSPRNRSYSSKSWYLQQKSCDRDRDRDKQYRSESSRDRPNNSKEKYHSSDYTRSPKDRKPLSKELGYPTNHDRNNSDVKSSNVNKSIGQGYSTSKDSQRKLTHSTRDKREDGEPILKVGNWSEHISSSGKKYYYNCRTEVSQWAKPREWLEKEGLLHLARSQGSSSSSRSGQDKHSSNRSNSIVNNYRDHHKYRRSREREISNSSSSNWNNRDNVTYKDEQHFTEHKTHESSSSVLGAVTCESQTQDMEISSENSTPTFEHYAPSNTSQQHAALQVHQNSVSGSLSSSCTATSKLASLHVSQTESKQETVSSCSSSFNSVAVTPTLSNNAKIVSDTTAVNQLKVDPNDTCDTGGPPTPTHSETQDDVEPKVGASPETPSVSALHGITSQGFYPMQLPQLTPGLSQYVKDDLTEHVRGWPAETCERQAHKLATEAHLITSMRITDISIALKLARSRVRLNEIQSTLLEQKVMLYRHEVKSLENMKTPSLFTTEDN